MSVFDFVCSLYGYIPPADGSVAQYINLSIISLSFLILLCAVSILKKILLR